MDEGTGTRPLRRHKFLFWIILGALSTFFAEVIAGSTPFPFFVPWGIFIVFPLYFLHTLFFFYMVWSYGKPTLGSLYAAGMLFGMYEAYLTKVVWISFVEEGPILSVGGIALFETLLLVLFWHSVLAFMVPVFVGETYLMKSRELVGLLPEWVRKRGRLLFTLLIIWGGLFTSVNSPSPVISILSTLSSGMVLLLLMVLWKKTAGERYSMREMLPGRRASKVIVVLLVLMYAVYTRLLRWDRLPGLGPQLFVWVIYAGLIWLLVKNIRKSREEKIAATTACLSWKAPVLFLFLFVLSAVAGEVLHIEIALILFSFLLIIFPGLFLFYRSVRKAVGYWEPPSNGERRDSEHYSSEALSFGNVDAGQ